MKSFKFFNNKTTPPIRVWGSNSARTRMSFPNGHSIIRTFTPHGFHQNEIKHGNYYPFRFWWANRYDYFERLNDRTTPNHIFGFYEGTISRFQATYHYRREISDRGNYFSRIPVISQIEYEGAFFYADGNLHFSNDDMWVKITYKIFVR